MNPVAIPRLVDRMTDKTEVVRTETAPWGTQMTVTTNEDSPSWVAYREAKALANPALVPDVERLLTDEKDKRRKAAYLFILGCIGANTADVQVVAVLCRTLPHEHDKGVLDSLFQALQKQPRIPDATPILPFLVDRRGTVRHMAIRALKTCTDPRTEAVLLDILDRTDDEFDRAYALEALSGAGSTRAVPVLRRLYRRFEGEAKAVVIDLLARWGDESCQPDFVQALGDRSFGVRWSAMSAIRLRGNQQVVEPNNG